jgi:hypothetical protein
MDNQFVGGVGSDGKVEACSSEHSRLRWGKVVVELGLERDVSAEALPSLR